MSILSSSFSSAQQTTTSGASLDLNFLTGQLDPRITFTRADSISCATYFDQSGLLQIQSANKVLNSTMQGVTLGVIGSGGVLPTGWNIVNVTGITKEIVGTGVLPSGYQYIDIRLYGTNTSGATGYPDIYVQNPNTGPTAAQGQTWTASTLVQVIAGSSSSGFLSANRGFFIGYYTSANAYIESNSSAPNYADNTLKQITVTKTGVSATIAKTGAYFDMSLPNGNSIDVTLRIAAPQLEQSASKNTYSPTYGTVNSGPRFDYDPNTVISNPNSELIVNGNFSNGTTGWTLLQPTSGSVSVVNGGLRINSIDGSFCYAQQNVLTTGVKYVLTFDLTVVSGTLIVCDGSLNYKTYSSSGSYSLVFQASNTVIQFKRAGVCDFTIDNVSVKSVTNATYQPKGLLIEEGRTNNITNNTMQGVVTGTPGTAPTGWNSNVPTWLTRTITGTGTDPVVGLPYVDYQMVGTNSNGVLESIVIDPVFPNVVPATSGQTWTSSAYFGLMSGVWPTSAVSIGTVARSSASAGLGNQYQTLKTLVNGQVPQRVSSTYTTVDVNTAYIQTVIRLDIAAGDSVNLTLRIIAPQLEQGAFPTSVIKTTNASVTRMSDVASMSGTNFSSWFNNNTGTFYTESQQSSTTPSGAYNVIETNDGTVNNLLGIRNDTSGAGVSGTAWSGGVNQTTITQSGLTVGAIDKASYAYATNDRALNVNGKNVLTNATYAVNPMTRMELGGSVTTTNKLAGWLRRVSYYKQRLPNVNLQSLTK